MTLGELIARHRPYLDDESVGVRRSWEDMFKYTLRLYAVETELQAFDLGELNERLLASNLHHPIVEGYVKRWKDLLLLADEM